MLLLPPEDRVPKKGKGGTSPAYASTTGGKTPQKDGEWRLVEKKKKKKRKKKEERGHMVGENGLSENQFGFRKGRSTVDAIQPVVEIATQARRGTCKRKGFCALISIDIRNALLVTDRRSSQYPKIFLGEHEIVWKKSIRYMGVQLNRRLSFGEHLQIATAKAIQCGAALTRLMPNIGGPREAKRRQVASVVNSKLLYAAPVWAKALQYHAIQRKLFSAQRLVALRVVSAYRTVSTSAALVLASVPPIDSLAEERKGTFQLRKELTCLTNLQDIVRAKEAIRKDGKRRLFENGRRDGMVSNPGDEHTV